MTKREGNKEVMQFGDDTRGSIGAGVKIMADAVKATLGPKGRYVVIDRPLGPPHITKDGVTVARDVRLTDQFESMGARILRGAAERQNEEVGDGTTTVTVLTDAIYREGVRLVAAGANPMDLDRGIKMAANAVIAEIKDAARGIPEDVGEVYKVALISANGDEVLAVAIAEAIVAVGREGVVTVEEATGHETTVEMVNGFKINAGFVVPHFMNNQAKGTCELEDPLILIYDGSLDKLNEVSGILEAIIKEGRNVLIIAEKYGDIILKTLVQNRIQANWGVCAIKAPGYAAMRTELLDDVALVAGTQVTNKTSPIRLQNLKLDHLGNARRVIVDKDKTLIVDGAGDKEQVDARCEDLRNHIAAASEEEKEALQKKLAAILGGIAVLKVGASTKIEMLERKDRVDDAIHATRAAVRGGIVAGGGACLVHAAALLEDTMESGGYANADKMAGAQIFLKALREPARQIAKNSGKEGYAEVSRVEREEDWGFGYDAQNDVFGNLLDLGIIDPAEVVIASVRNAASIAALLLTTEVMITEKKDRKDA